MKILVFTGLLAASLFGCAPTPTSTCGAYISPEQCEQDRMYFRGWIAQSCVDGELADKVARQYQTSNPASLPGARVACQDAASGMDLDDIFNNRLADIKCTIIEQNYWNSGRLESLFDNTIGHLTKLGEVDAKMKEQLRSLCNEFRNGRISSKDALYNETRIYRKFDKEITSTYWQDMWAYLTWPVKILVGLLGILATVVGIIAGLKSIFSK